MIFTYSPFHAFTEIVRSSLSCSSWGTFEKKFSPVAFSTQSTVTIKAQVSYLKADITNRY